MDFYGCGWLILFIGLGIIINGLFLTVPHKMIEDKTVDADKQRQLDGLPTNELKLPKLDVKFCLRSRKIQLKFARKRAYRKVKVKRQK